MPGTDHENAITSTPILILGDRRAMASLIRELLDDPAFHDMSVASDGSAALGKLTARQFGIVLSDIFVEPVGGLDLLRAMRAYEQSRHRRNRTL